MRSYHIPDIDMGNYIYRFELHAHTKYASKCGDMLPEEAVRVYHARGFDALVLTNHIRPDYADEQLLAHAEAYETAKAAAESYGMHIYFGAELTFSDLLYNDFLVYGVLPSDLPALKRFVEDGSRSFAASPLRRRCAVFTAHPYRNDRVGAECFVPEISDGVESFNMHPRVNSDNGFMSRFASEHGYLTICGTDYHHKGHEAMAALLAKQLPRNEAELSSFLLSGDFLFEINENIVIPSHRITDKTR